MAEETKETKKVISKEKKPKKKKKKRKILVKISIVFLFLVVIGWFTIGMKVMKLRAEAKDLVDVYKRQSSYCSPKIKKLIQNSKGYLLRF